MLDTLDVRIQQRHTTMIRKLIIKFRNFNTQLDAFNVGVTRGVTLFLANKNESHKNALIQIGRNVYFVVHRKCLRDEKYILNSFCTSWCLYSILL